MLSLSLGETAAQAVVDLFLKNQPDAWKKLDGLGDRAYLNHLPRSVALMAATQSRFLLLQQVGNPLPETDGTLARLARLILSREWPNPDLYVAASHSAANEVFGNTALAAYQKNIESMPQSAYNLEGAAALLFAMQKYEDARRFLQRAISADPSDAELYCNLGVTDWKVTYDARMQVKSKLQIPLADPISDITSCNELRIRNLPVVQDGIDRFGKALELRTGYDIAKAYLNLMWREKADLECGNAKARQADLQTADEWVHKLQYESNANFNAPPSIAPLGAVAPRALQAPHFIFAVQAPPPWLGLPSKIPREIKMVKEDEDAPPTIAGVVGGLTGGIPNGGMGGVLGGIVGSSLPPPKGGAPLEIRVSSGVVAANKISGPNPIYPAIARTARIQGTVILQATISKFGIIENLQAVSGPPMLYQASIDAVQQWRYKPYILNGQAVDIQTTIQVNFTLNSGDAPFEDAMNGVPPQLAGSASQSEPLGHLYVPSSGIGLVGGAPCNPMRPIPKPPRVYLDQKTMKSRLQTFVQPVYPPPARAEHVQGTVLLNVVIGKDGTVREAKSVCGAPMLAGAALDAVKQWTFEPYLLDGRPVEVESQFALGFTINGAPQQNP